MNTEVRKQPFYTEKLENADSDKNFDDDGRVKRTGTCSLTCFILCRGKLLAKNLRFVIVFFRDF